MQRSFKSPFHNRSLSTQIFPIPLPLCQNSTKPPCSPTPTWSPSNQTTTLHFLVQKAGPGSAYSPQFRISKEARLALRTFFVGFLGGFLAIVKVGGLKRTRERGGLLLWHSVTEYLLIKLLNRPWSPNTALYANCQN